MGLRDAIQDRKPDGHETSNSRSTPSKQSTGPPPRGGQSTRMSTEQAEQHYGMAVPDTNTLYRLRSAERTYGKRVHDWVDEGMPTDIMGKTRDMEAFRQRQADRPSEVPTNIERQNNRSVQRSEKATAETGRSGKIGVPEPVREVISSTGRSLDASIQRAMEDRMGDSFGDVQIHTGSSAAAACESITARAFTVGSHIAFNSGEYDPESPEGQHVLAHELAHVRQQTGGVMSMLPQEDMQLEVDPDPTLEREAEEAAQQVMEDGPVVVNRMGTEMHIQRIPEDRVFQALALFNAELNEGDHSDHREDHNKHQLNYLHGIANDVLEKQNAQSDLDTKQTLLQDSNPVADELTHRFDSVVDLKSQVEDLQSSIDDDLEDVALTEDQQQKLYGGGEADNWDNASWTLVKTMLTAVGVPQLLEVANLAKQVGGTAITGATTAADASTQAASYDVNERAKQTLGEVRRDVTKGEVPDLDDVKDIWRQTNGTLENRAEQIEEEIRDGTWFEDASRGLSQSTKNGE